MKIETRRLIGELAEKGHTVADIVRVSGATRYMVEKTLGGSGIAFRRKRRYATAKTLASIGMKRGLIAEMMGVDPHAVDKWLAKKADADTDAYLSGLTQQMIADERKVSHQCVQGNVAGRLNRRRPTTRTLPIPDGYWGRLLALSAVRFWAGGCSLETLASACCLTVRDVAIRLADVGWLPQAELEVLHRLPDSMPSGTLEGRLEDA